jgi:hypothetical protein
MRYRIEPEYKKSALERQIFSKDGKRIICDIWWRWATFECVADEPPVITEDDELYTLLDDLEFIESSDGDEEHDYEGFTDDEIEEMDAFLEENSIYDLEEEGWSFEDTEWYIKSPVLITEVDDE